MELNDRDIDWQNDAPSLAAIGNKIPFSVPDGYFDSVSDELQRRARLESLRTGIHDGFILPEHYFEGLTSTIEDKIAVEKIREFSPSEGFATPVGYFDMLTDEINSKVSISARPVRRILTSWISYAAAACITVMIASGLYFNSDTYTFNQKLSEVPDEEILNYLQAHSTPGDTPFIIETLNPEELEQISPEVSAEELESYINSTSL